MATFQIDIPDAVAPELLAALRARYANQIPVGATDAQVVRRSIRYFLRQELAVTRADQTKLTEDNKVKAAKDARDAAIQAAADSADAARGP